MRGSPNAPAAVVFSNAADGLGTRSTPELPAPTPGSGGANAVVGLGSVPDAPRGAAMNGSTLRVTVDHACLGLGSVRDLEQCARLAVAVPVQRLRRPRSLAGFGQLAALGERDAGSGAGPAARA
jgi:hypothetical protein